MQRIFKDKALEISICTFFTFIIVLGMIGSYFVVFQLGNLQRDFSAMKLITYVPMVLVSVYALVYAKKNHESGVVSALVGVLLISALTVKEALLGAVTDVINGRKIFEFIAEAAKGMFVFMLLDCFIAPKAMVQRIWYLALSFITLFVPAIYVALYWFASTMNFAAAYFIPALYILHAMVFVYAVISLVLSILYKKTFNKTALWGNRIFSISMLLYATLSILNMIFQDGKLEHYIDAITILTDIGLITIVMACVKMHTSLKSSAKKKYN